MSTLYKNNKVLKNLPKKEKGDKCKIQQFSIQPKLHKYVILGRPVGTSVVPCQQNFKACRLLPSTICPVAVIIYQRHP